MQRRRQLMTMQTGGLPGAYRRVEYIRSTGKQYFWTDINVQDGLTVDSVQSVYIFNDSYLFGGAANVNNARSNFNGFYSNKLQGAYPAAYYNSQTILNYDTIYHITTTHAAGVVTAYVDGSLFYSTSRSGTVPETGAKCVCFGARKSDGTVITSNLYKGDVYSIKVSKGNIILADFIPCVRKSDNKPGMYDTVSKTFYTSAGTGEFIVPA